MKRTLLGVVVGLLVALALLVIVAMLAPGVVMAACRAEPVTPETPTGIAGCVVYGEGIASQWGGPGVARNDCVYPWTGCAAIEITSLKTGLSVVVIPTMFCDCYTGTADQRIVDLDPATVAALGLDASRGLHAVTVEPWTIDIPDTAMAP